MNTKLIIIIVGAILVLFVTIYALKNAQTKKTTSTNIGGTDSTGGILGNLFDGFTFGITV